MMDRRRTAPATPAPSFPRRREPKFARGSAPRAEGRAGGRYTNLDSRLRGNDGGGRALQRYGNDGDYRPLAEKGAA
jgi:hypothetical protein